LDAPEDANKYLYDEILSEVPNPENVAAIKIHNETVRIVRNNFPSHHPFYITPAVKMSKDRNKLDTLPEDVLDPEYLEQMNEVRSLLMKHVPKKFLKRAEPMTCEEYAEFLENIMPAVNDDTIDLKHVMYSIVQRAVDLGRKVYVESMTRLSLPMAETEWNEAEAAARSEAIRIYRDIFNNSDQGFWKETGEHELISFLQQQQSVFKHSNELESEYFCEKVFEEACAKLKIAATSSRSEADFEEKSSPVMEKATNSFIGPKKGRYISRITNMHETYLSNVKAKAAPDEVWTLLL